MKNFKTIDAAYANVESGKYAHSITWFINGEMTFQQWVDLDSAMCDAFESVGINMERVYGIAGPIPND